jgi:uncharacterized membrane protein YfhO
MSKAELSFSDQTMPYQVKCSEGITFNKGRINVEKAKATITLTFNGLKGSETYLNFRNIWYTGDTDIASISLRSDKIKNSFYLSAPSYSFYSGKHDYLMNLHYSADTRNEIVVSFSNKGEYTFDNLSIICQPMADYPKQIASLKENVLENVSVENNSVTGTLDLTKNKILCLTIPYSTGWTAYVDGQKAELLHVNTMYMGIAVTPGHHSIELKYFTRELVDFFEKRNILPWVYCVDNEEWAYKTIELGGTLVTCNDPAPALRVFKEKGYHK